ncbi:hypothetical protein WBJ53_13805 [Spirosoma sp. SC4-14]|uniref:hypothetical protein n=1 Tax=Spirosoma sp. SC4-14 TaxID=3128900 RepID=UPI0030CC8AED
MATTTLTPNLSDTLANIQAKTEETLKVITPLGFVLDTSEWLTITRYAQKYGVTTQLVNKWIEREVIPADCVETLTELNNIKLVKDQAYR